MNAETGEGWQPGLIGWSVQEHATYYAQNWNFGAFFEAKLAHEMSDFTRRLDRPCNHLYWARDDAGFLATITLDGDEAEDGLAHLRWFIANDRCRGQGLGHALVARCVEAARDDGHEGIYLTTFAGLDAARRCYERAGFCLAEEAEDATWGRTVTEQRFELGY